MALQDKLKERNRQSLKNRGYNFDNNGNITRQLKMADGKTYNVSLDLYNGLQELNNQNYTLGNYVPKNDVEKKILENVNNTPVKIKDSGGNEYTLTYKDYVSFNDARNGKLGGDWAAITYPQGENEGKIAGYYNRKTGKQYTLDDINSIVSSGVISPEGVKVLTDYGNSEKQIQYNNAVNKYIKDNNLEGIAKRYGMSAEDLMNFDIYDLLKMSKKLHHFGDFSSSTLSFNFVPKRDGWGGRFGKKIATEQEEKDMEKLHQLANNNAAAKLSQTDGGALWAAVAGVGDGISFGTISALSDWVGKKKYADAGLNEEYYVSPSQARAKTIAEHEYAYGGGQLAGTVFTSLGVGGLVSGGLKAAGWAVGTAPIARGAVVQGLTGVIRGGTTTAAAGGDWGDIGTNALREGLTGAAGGAVGGIAEKGITKLLNNSKYATSTLGKLKNLKTTAYGVNALGGVADALADYKTDQIFVGIANNVFDANLQERTGKDLLTDFAVSLALGTAMNIKQNTKAGVQTRIDDVVNRYGAEFTKYSQQISGADVDVETRIKAGEEFIETTNKFKKEIDEQLFPGKAKEVETLHQMLDIAIDSTKMDIERAKSGETKTESAKPVSTETSVVPKPTTTKPTVTKIVSTEGGVVKEDINGAIERIQNGTATNKDFETFKTTKLANRKMLEDALGIKLPETNSETRKMLKELPARLNPTSENIISRVGDSEKASIETSIEKIKNTFDGTGKDAKQLIVKVSNISDETVSNIKQVFGIDVDYNKILDTNLKALANNPDSIISESFDDNAFVKGYADAIGSKLNGITPGALKNSYFGNAPINAKIAEGFRNIVDSSAERLKAEYEGMQSTKVVGDVLHTVNTEYTHMYDVDKVEQGFVDSVNSEIEQAIENIRSGNVEKVPDNIEVTKLTDKTKSDLGGIAGFDISDYSCKIEKDTLFHIEDRHGMNGKHDSSLSDPQDVARMGYIINNYDNVVRAKDENGKDVYSRKYNDKNNRPSPVLMMTKKIDGTYCVSYVVPDSKKKTLWITSARIQKADVGSQVPNGNTPQLTPEAPLVSSSANNNIPQKADTVNNEYMPKSGEVFTDNSENGFTRIDDIDDSFGVRISEGKNEYGNDVLKIDIDNPDVDAVTDSAEYKRLIENSFEIKETKGVTLTAERAFEKAFGKNYEDFRKVVYDNLDKSKLQYMNVLDFLTKGLEENVINRGIKKGSKDSELLQKYGEGLITQAELMSMTDNWQNIVEADRYIRKMYDSLIDSVNDTKKKIYPHIEEQEADLKKDLAKVNEQLDLIEQGKLDALPISKSNKVLRAQELEKALKTIDGNSKLTIKGLEGQIDNIKNTMAGKKNKSTKVYAELETRLSKLEAKKQRLEEYFNLSKNQKFEKLNSLLGEYENSDVLSFGISKKTKEDLIAKRKRIEDELYDETRWRGKRIPKRKDYYHHFQEFSNSILGELLNRKNSNISAELVLVSEHTKPRSKWESFAQRRKGETTQYDAVAGYLDYIDAAVYAMTIDPNISIIRKLTDDIVHETSSSNTNTHGTNNANATIQRLDALANELSGKTVSQVDRVVQDAIGRKNFRIAKNVVNRMKSSSIVGNIGSSVVQVSNLPNAVGTLKYKSSLITALTDSWTEWKPGKNKLSDAFMNRTDIQKKSPFLRERYFDVKSQFDTGVFANAQKLANWMLTVGDEFSTRLTWNAFYREAQKVGVENPIQYADSKTRKCVGGRGLGEKSLAQQSATLTSAFPFTLEVSNAWQVQKDLGKDLFKGIKSGDVKSATNGVRDFLSLYVATAVLSAALNEIRGSDGGMFNPIGIIYDNICEYYFGDDEDKENNVFLKTAQEVTGNFVGSLPVGQKVAELWPENGMEIGDTKIASRSDLFGSEDPTRYGTSNLITSAIKHPLTSFIPGGAQIRKTAGAVEVLKDGGVYDNKGNLKYPVERNAENYIKGLLFGKSAFDETKDFYADDRSALSEKQTAEFRNRVANGENPQAVYNDFIQQREADNQYTKTVEANVKPFDTTTADALTEIYEEYQNIDADAHTIGVPKATRVFKYKGKSYDLTAEQYAELQNRYNTEYYEEIIKILNNNNLSVERKYKKIAEIRSDVMSDVKSQFYREVLK